MQTNEPVPNQRGTVAERAAAQLTAAPLQTFLLNVAPFTLSIFDGAGGRVDYFPGGAGAIAAALIPFVWGRSLRNAPEVATGTRPLASSVPEGSIAYATDANYVGMCVPHPIDPTKRVWKPISQPQRQLVSVSLGATTNGRGAFYDAVGNTVAHPVGGGEFCNCYVSAGSANGAPCLISAQNYLLNVQTAANRTIGSEFMVDAGGINLVPYVNNGVNISLGTFGSEGSTLAGGFASGLMFDW